MPDNAESRQFKLPSVESALVLQTRLPIRLIICTQKKRSCEPQPSRSLIIREQSGKADAEGDGVAESFQPQLLCWQPSALDLWNALAINVDFGAVL